MVSDFAILAQKWSEIAARQKVYFGVSSAPDCAILTCIVLEELAGGRGHVIHGYNFLFLYYFGFLWYGATYRTRREI